MHDFLHFMGSLLIPLLPFLIGLFIHSPLGSKLPANCVRFLTSISPDTAKVIYNKAVDLAYCEANDRYDVAVRYVLDIAARCGDTLTLGEAEYVVDWIVREFRAGRILRKPDAA